MFICTLELGSAILFFTEALLKGLNCISTVGRSVLGGVFFCRRVTYRRFTVYSLSPKCF